MPIILIPLIWLAAATLVVAACQVAARADARRSQATLAEAAPQQPAARAVHPAPGPLEISRSHSGHARERAAMLHTGR